MKSGDVILLGALAGCGYKVEEVECADLDTEFHAAQVGDLRNEIFQMFLNPRLEAAGLENEIVAQDLPEAATQVELRCATSIQNKGEEPLSGMDVEKAILWLDVDQPSYLDNRTQFETYIKSDDTVEGYYAYTDGVGGQIFVTGHELAHFIFGGVDHSEETQDFIAAIPSDNDMSYCEGWTFVAEKTEDKIYDVQAEIACAYDSFAPFKREELAEF